MSNYIKQYYNVPADVGRRVIFDSKKGIITSIRGHYLSVNFDEDKPNVSHNVHPTWRVEYLEMGTPRPMTRSQKRYQRFLSFGDAFDSFIDFCKWDSKQPKY